MSELIFNPELAKKSSSGGYITTGGVYVGKLTKAISVSKDNGVKYVEFAFESESGEKCDYVKVYTKNKDGSENFAMGKIHALMGILNIKSLAPARNGENIELPALIGKQIGVILQKEEFRKNDGSIGFSMKLLHFVNPVTYQTFSEMADNKDAKKYLKEVKDVLLEGDRPNSGGSFNNPPAIEEDDLPF